MPLHRSHARACIGGSNQQRLLELHIWGSVCYKVLELPEGHSTHLPVMPSLISHHVPFFRRQRSKGKIGSLRQILQKHMEKMNLPMLNHNTGRL